MNKSNRGRLIRKVISGGQTGVDRAALDAAMEAGIPTGGYCPLGRLSEDGTIPERYPMIELDSSVYSQRTEKNVVASDGILILNIGELTEGTLLTREFAAQHGKPYLVVQLDVQKVIKQDRVINWLEEQEIQILNISGPRELQYTTGIYVEAHRYLQELFSLAKDRPDPS